MTYTNTGPATAHHVVISDVLPSMLINISFDSSGPEITAREGSQYIWDVADLTQGQTGTITITATVSPTFSGLITNTASIATSARELDTNNNLAGPVFTSVEQTLSEIYLPLINR